MRLRLGTAVVPPPHVRAALAALFGAALVECLDEVRVIECSLFAWLHVRAVATTRRRRIFLRGTAADFFDDPVLMLHEYCHVLLQWEPRRLTTLRYLRECLRRGYWENHFEVQARAFARDNLQRFRSLLRGHDANISRAAPRADTDVRRSQ
ncbi:MAG TPA: hypothetical protein VMG11_09655 [Steroidobacteraceae bacterium]|nr:hypothetical protein [Steroidobacteraceae bacterium]